jgi:hypothetical protein
MKAIQIFSYETNTLTKEVFDGLLAKLSEEDLATDSSSEYERLRFRLERFFRIKGLTTPRETADIALDRLATAIKNNVEPIENINQFAFAIARIIYQEQLRLETREREANEQFLLLQKKNNNASEKLIRKIELCFQALPENEQGLIEEYYLKDAPDKLDTNRAALAARHGLSTNCLRQKLFRIRLKLEKMIAADL